MPLHKVTYEFEATTGAVSTAGSKSGWSESYYDPSDLGDPAALVRANALKDKRRALLTRGWSIVSLRVSRLLPVTFFLARQGFHFFVPPGQQPGQAISTSGTPYADEQPYDGLAVSYIFLNGSGRTRVHRGIPGEIITAGARYVEQAAWVNAFGRWNQALNGVLAAPLDAPWAQRFRVNGNRFPLIGVITADADGVNASPVTPALVLAAGTVFPFQQSLNVSGVLGMRGINGSWQPSGDAVTGISGKVYLKLFQKRRRTVVGVYASGGVVQGYNYEMRNFVVGTPQYGVSRRTGRPLQLTRGRRSARE